MKYNSTFLGFLIFGLLVSACSNVSRVTNPSLIGAPIAEIRYLNQNTVALQMSRTGDQLHLTGSPFGYMIWSLSNPQSPTLLTSVAQNIAAYSQIGFWRLDWLASGALVAFNQFAAMSGSMGASLASSVNGSSSAQEVWRYANPDQYGGQTRDLGWVYSAMTRDPQSGTVYGLTQDEYIYLLNANSNSLSLRTRYRYNPNTTVCCALGAAVLGSNLFVGMTSKLLIYPIASGGALGTPMEYAGFQATRMVATDNYLYLVHQPSASFPQGQSRAAGIYIIDMNGRIVGSLPIVPTGAFEVYSVPGSGNYLYVAGKTSILVYNFN